MTAECPTCGDSYKQLGNHWQFAENHRPSFSEYQKELVTGLVMGDGCVANRDGNPYLTISTASERFLEWLDSEFGVHSTGVVKSYDADDLADRNEEDDNIEVVNRENYHDQYRLKLRNSPYLKEFAEWYSSGEKKYPSDIDLTPTVVKMWYVSDGVLGWGKMNGLPRVQLRILTQDDVVEHLCDELEEYGFTPNYSSGLIYLRREDTGTFLEWIGEAVDGYEYKWCLESRQEMNEIKERCLK